MCVQIRDGVDERCGPLLGAHGLQGDREEDTDPAGVGSGEHGRPLERLHLQGADGVLRKVPVVRHRQRRRNSFRHPPELKVRWTGRCRILLMRSLLVEQALFLDDFPGDAGGQNLRYFEFFAYFVEFSRKICWVFEKCWVFWENIEFFLQKPWVFLRNPLSLFNTALHFTK